MQVGLKGNAVPLRTTIQLFSLWMHQDIRCIAVLVSVVLSAWAFYANDTINLDGILYLDVAHQLTLGNWDEAYRLYSWPFYPSLIAGLATVTPFDVVISAGILNTILYAAVIWLFLTVLKYSGADPKTMLAGCLIILIHPHINEYRADLIRGPGKGTILYDHVKNADFLAIRSKHVPEKTLAELSQLPGIELVKTFNALEGRELYIHRRPSEKIDR